MVSRMVLLAGGRVKRAVKTGLPAGGYEVKGQGPNSRGARINAKAGMRASASPFFIAVGTERGCVRRTSRRGFEYQ